MHQAIVSPTRKSLASIADGLLTLILDRQVEIEGSSTPQISVFDRDDGTYLGERVTEGEKGKDTQGPGKWILFIWKVNAFQSPTCCEWPELANWR